MKMDDTNIPGMVFAQPDKQITDTFFMLHLAKFVMALT